MTALRVLLCFCNVILSLAFLPSDLLLTFASPNTTHVNLTLALASVELSAVAYCDPSTYLTHSYKSPNTQFIPYESFYDSKTDMHGYVGYNPELEKIFVVYRGTKIDSKSNLYSDLQSSPVSAAYVNCTSCKVHKGFKACHDNTFKSVLHAVANLTATFPTYQLIVTGHSLGASTATLSTIALEHAGYHPMLYNFGSPRVGNSAFASYVASLLPPERTPIRFTHNRDMIPHLPFTFFGYQHIGIEVFEDINHELFDCIGSDDSKCAAQFAFTLYSFFVDSDDHLHYLNRYILCE